MKLDQFPEAIRPHLIPKPGGEMVYRCLGCRKEHGIETLLYTCPDCGRVLLLHVTGPAHVRLDAALIPPGA